MNLQDQQLVAAAFEGALDEAGFQRLQERMRREPGLVALYREHALLHHSLCEEFEGRHMMGDALPRVEGRPWKVLALLGTAALLLGFAGWGWKLAFPDAPRPSAGWSLSADAVATVDGRPVTADGELAAGSRLSVERLLLDDRFDAGTTLAGRRPAVGDSRWRLERGTPEWKGSHLEGGDFEAYFSLPPGCISAARPILLATLETVATADFHTTGWAGFSLYQDGYEVCFFGDSYGPEETWSLDVKRSLYPLMPEPRVTGARTMTLRYDRRDGTVEMHEGPEPGDEALVRSKILPGMTFDQVRIGASAGARLGLSRLTVRSVEGAAVR